MSFKSWLNVVTLVLIALVLFLARHDIAQAFLMLGRVNVWVFLLVIPAQFLSYFAHGEIVFSYLRQRGYLERVSHFEAARVALEFNFVNHVFPTGGMSGVSYMTWRLNKLGVSTGRATLTQVVKFGMTFLAYAVLAVVALFAITADVGLNRYAILVTSGLIILIILCIFGAMYLFSHRERLNRFERFIDRLLNRKIKRLLRRRKDIVNAEVITSFFDDMCSDYRTLRERPKLLLWPFVWGLVFNVAEAALFFVTFLALGHVVNPAPILVATGLAGLVGAFFVTPGGAGGYEAMMVVFLTSVGVSASVALAGVVLARTALILMTIATGYITYHRAIKTYGKAPTAS